MREIILTKLAGMHASRPWRMLLMAVAITILLGAFAGQLSVTMRTSDLLPEGDPKVEQFNKILDEFQTATNLVVVVEGEEQDIKAFADVLADRILELRDTTHNQEYQEEIQKLQEKITKLSAAGGKEEKIAELQSRVEVLEAGINMKLFQRVDYKTPIDFLMNHMLMLVKEEDLVNLKDVYTDPNLITLLANINNSMEKEYVGQEESISTREKEDGAVSFLDGIQNLVDKLKSTAQGKNISEAEIRAAADKLLFGEPYLLSYDEKALILNAIPNFSLMERDFIKVATETAQALVDDLLQDFPSVAAGLSGQIAREHDEDIYSRKSIGSTTFIALIAILAFLMISFRMWVAPVLAVVNLVVGLIWAMGFAEIVVGQLNMLTLTLSVIFLGLGIDFSIHLISAFTEWRAAGDSIATAMEKTFLKSGKGIVTGATTTACAFLTLVISQARGMREMGLVAGTGLLAILLATMLFLPVLLVFRERRIDRRREKSRGKVTFVQRDISFRFLGSIGEWLSQHYVFTVAVSLAMSGVLIWSALLIKWDYDFRKMEPKGLTSVNLMDTILDKFDLSMEYALVLTDDVEESRELAERYREIGSVAITDDISVFIPSPEQQQKRVPHINEVKEKVQTASIKQQVLSYDLSVMIQEIERLEMNIMEMQDMAFLGGRDKVDDKCKQIVGDPDDPDSANMMRELQKILNTDVARVTEGLSGFQKSFGPYFQETIVKMCSTDPIQLEDLPVSTLDRYSNTARSQFLVTVYPAGSIYDGMFFNRFVDDLERVSEKATGMPPLSLALVKVFGRDGRNAVLLTVVIVFLLLWMDFKRVRYALIAMIPLALGLFWMVGLMRFVGIQLSIMSVMGLPLIIGIGIDDGVHIMHRWRSEGNDRIRTVFSSTGKAILLTSLTTMLAFGSMVFSVFPAWGLFGGALFIGVGACFLTTVIILPGIFGIIERKRGD